MHSFFKISSNNECIINTSLSIYIFFREILKIMAKLTIDSKELRGIGIQLTRLEAAIENKNNGLIKFLGDSKKQTGDEVNSKKKKENCPSSSSRTTLLKIFDLSLSQASIFYYGCFHIYNTINFIVVLIHN